MIGKLRSSFKTYFKNKKSEGKKLIPFLKALRLFAKNSDLYVSRFDKGNGVVIDKKENYVRKMTDILSDDSRLVLFESRVEALFTMYVSVVWSVTSVPRIIRTGPGT